MHLQMKKLLLSIFAAAGFMALSPAGFAAETNDVTADMKAIVAKINAKLQAGKMSEADMADDIKAFDALYAKHKSEKTDAVAGIQLMKAQLYMQVLQDPEKAVECFQQIKRDMPDTKTGQMAEAALEPLKEAVAAQQIRKALVPGKQFPDFLERDLAGKLFSVADYKGKVVLVDFWATWCVPCVMEMPNVIATYNKYHDKGFEIVGVSLDDDKSALEKFIKESKMPWPEYFDGMHFKTKLAVKYGVQAIPSNYLLDGSGKIIGYNLRGEELDKAVAKALKK
jgi:thiol-disulfide isomerase/thioredoxin